MYRCLPFCRTPKLFDTERAGGRRRGAPVPLNLNGGRTGGVVDLKGLWMQKEGGGEL